MSLFAVLKRKCGRNRLTSELSFRFCRLINLWRMLKGLHPQLRAEIGRFQNELNSLLNLFIPCRQINLYKYCRVKVRIFPLLNNLWKRSLIGRAGKFLINIPKRNAI
jgi:hypothetical protein